jgi:sugar phosphate isomerase/epimerase
LASQGIRQLELAPTKIWPPDWNAVWKGSESNGLAKLNSELQLRHFTVPSYQAILFGCPNMQFFGSEMEQVDLKEHMKRVNTLASRISGSGQNPNVRPPAIVLGAPRNRLMLGHTESECFDMLVSALKELAEDAWQKRVVLVMEANPKDYKCEFVYTAEQAAAVVRAVGHFGLRLHVDLACMHLAGENIAEIVEKHRDIIYHVHISEPYLEAFAEPKSPHAKFSASLKQNLWFDSNVRFSLEMKNGENNVERVKTAVSYVLTQYF